MIKIETIEVSGFEGAILGMRNPLKSRDKSDSGWESTDDGDNVFRYVIGPKDLELCQKLLASGKDDDSKFMRMIHVQCDIFAPLYWWKEMDTYKVSTTSNSESTMHTIHRRPLGLEDFSHDMVLDDYTLDDQEWDPQTYLTPMEVLVDTIDMLNHTRDLYFEALRAKDNKKITAYWYNLIQMLPSSYMQLRTWDADYQTLRRIYFARKGHKLEEWHKFREWVESLPYAEELICLTHKLDNRPKSPELTKKQIFMGKTAKLLSDMTINGATKEEIEQVVKYSIDIINSDKTGADLDELRKKYDISTFEQKYSSVSP